MSYRNANYCAFYVDEPFFESNLKANVAPDFCYYNTLYNKPKIWTKNSKNSEFAVL